MATTQNTPYQDGDHVVALTWQEARTAAGQVATDLAKALRRAGVPGPVATTTGGDNVAVVVAWPSGNDQVVAAVEVWDHTPTIHIGAYEDHEDAEPVSEYTAHTIPAGVAQVARLVRTHTTNADTPTGRTSTG